jgi:hypothetical protein
MWVASLTDLCLKSGYGTTNASIRGANYPVQTGLRTRPAVRDVFGSADWSHSPTDSAVFKDFAILSDALVGCDYRIVIIRLRVCRKV